MKKVSFAYGIAGAAMSFFFAIMMIMSMSVPADGSGIPDGLLGLIGAAIGVTGAALIRHNKYISAIMMLAAAAANIIDTVALGASIFLVIGAVLVFISKDEEDSKPFVFRTLSLTLSILGGATLLFFFGSLITADMLSYFGQIETVTITVIRLAGALVGALGGIFIFSKRIVSAILMLAGAAAIILAAPGNLSVSMLSPCVLFVIGAAFALIPEKKQPAPVPETEE